MSRREFRAAVDAPRPVAAWVMVGVGGMTLWITGQLEPWAVAAQALALIASLHLRQRPHPWQASPVALNVGMLSVVGATIAVALSGQPSTVALAHFAALTQGLQLLDSRPRRSEFLLVALALFQVILAANLTDSIFFLPLLAAFVVSTTWTLVVHTLRTEAAEAGMPAAVTTAITPGLLRTTLLASSASLALALVFFVLLPRMRASVVHASGLGSSLAMAGFSDRVELGDLGRIRQDETVVMRVETLEGEEPEARDGFWQGLAFDHFDGRTWSVTPATRVLLSGSAEVGLSLVSFVEGEPLVQRIVREPVSSGVIFVAGSPWRLQGDLSRVQRDRNGGFYASAQARERIRYTVASQVPRWDDAELARDVAAAPVRDGDRFLQLPELHPAIAKLAREIGAESRNDAERARALERHLRRVGRYDDRPPRLRPDDPRSPVEAFLLGETTGHCEYFASSMVVLARSLGMPARLVNGFAGGRRNAIGGFIELTGSDAHAWVEIHFARAGWVRYDPTPPDLRLRAASALSLAGHLGELGSAIELWWFQRVVDFDRADQFDAMRSAWLAWRGRTHGAIPEPPAERLVDWRLDRVPAIGLPVLAALAAGLVHGLARLLRRPPRPGLPPAYDQALRLLARRGLIPSPTRTARDFAVRARRLLPRRGADAFDALTEAYLGERFGGRQTSPESRARLQDLRDALRR